MGCDIRLSNIQQTTNLLNARPLSKKPNFYSNELRLFMGQDSVGPRFKHIITPTKKECATVVNNREALPLLAKVTGKPPGYKIRAVSQASHIHCGENTKI